MSKLDKNRPAAILFDGERQMQFHYQDGKLFNMSTDEEVDLTSIPVKPKPAIICRFCNAKRETAELMHEHLMARHGAQIAQSKAKDDKDEEKAQEKPKILQCKLCDKIYKIGNSEKRATTLMEKHIKEIHPDKSKENGNAQ